MALTTAPLNFLPLALGSTTDYQVNVMVQPAKETSGDPGRTKGATPIGPATAPPKPDPQRTSMKANQSMWATGALTLAVSATLALAAEPTLTVGDKAPKLQNGKWIQGGPV